MPKSKLELLAPAITILVDGSIKLINLHKVRDREYQEALSIGIAELVHQGKLKLADIE